jgi:hypothetical protein
MIDSGRAGLNVYGHVPTVASCPDPKIAGSETKQNSWYFFVRDICRSNPDDFEPLAFAMFAAYSGQEKMGSAECAKAEARNKAATAKIFMAPPECDVWMVTTAVFGWRRSQPCALNFGAN